MTAARIVIDTNIHFCLTPVNTLIRAQGQLLNQIGLHRLN
jgi:hypothetical protein